MKNLILTGGIFHPFEKSSEAIYKLFLKEGIDSEIFENIEDGLNQLDSGKYDMLTFNTLRWSMQNGEKYEPYKNQWAITLSKFGQKSIWKFLENGGGILALHTAVICFDLWSEWGKILGAEWVWGQSYHPPYGKVFVKSGSNSHYINDDLGNFEINDEVYSKLKIENDIVPLFYARSATQEEWNPVVWARKVSNGKVFFDALGHDAESFNHPKHSEIIIRAKNWITDREKDY